MDQIFFIFLFFCFLFLIETKAINLLICFVGIILTLAIKLANLNSLAILEGEYISYILILVQVSALTILFGFLIMLYPTLPIQKIQNLGRRGKFDMKDVSIKSKSAQRAYFDSFTNTQNNNPKGSSYWPGRRKFGILLFCLLTLYLAYNYIKTPKEEFFNLAQRAIELMSMKGNKDAFFSIVQAPNSIGYSGSEKMIIPQDTKFLRDLGYYLYTNDNNILKLIILTIILLLAIIALFFLVAP